MTQYGQEIIIESSTLVQNKNRNVLISRCKTLELLFLNLMGWDMSQYFTHEARGRPYTYNFVT